MQFHTTVLSGAGNYSIDKADNALQVTIQAGANSSFMFRGNASFKGQSSINQTLTSGITLVSENTQSPLDGLLITWVSGTVNITIGVT